MSLKNDEGELASVSPSADEVTRARPGFPPASAPGGDHLLSEMMRELVSEEHNAQELGRLDVMRPTLLGALPSHATRRPVAGAWARPTKIISAAPEVTPPLLRKSVPLAIPRSPGHRAAIASDEELAVPQVTGTPEKINAVKSAHSMPLRKCSLDAAAGPQLSFEALFEQDFLPTTGEARPGALAIPVPCP
jgi:hypothetical protein